MTSLYRMHAADGRLLYVGISDNFAARMRQHWDDKPWIADVAEIAVTEYATRAEAMDAERQAVAHERPVHNIQLRHGKTSLRAMRIPAPLWQESLGKARSEGRTLSDVVRDILRDYVGGAA